MSEKNIKRIIKILKVVAHLPLGVLYFFSDLGYLIVYYIIRYRREVVRKNLVNSFPEKTEKEIIEIEKRFYHSLCDISVESFKLLHISDKEMLRRVDVQGTDIVEAAANDGKSIIVLTGHCGCWEWGQEVDRRYKNPTITSEIYKKITDPLVQAIMNEIRGRWGTQLIEMKQTLRGIVSLHKAGKPFLCGFISDQRPFSPLKHWTTFMNQHTDFISGGEEIATRIGAKIVYMDTVRTKRGHYRFTFKEIVPQDMTEDVPYTREFYRMLEKTIHNQPEIWLWSHNRWKWSFQFSA